jgi:uncharacterized Zn-binding protein involved in type VI secretion
MPPAARVTDMHVCPMYSGPTPHVGGPILGPGVSTVLIGGLPAATVGDMCQCTGSTDVITTGSGTVRIWREASCADGGLYRAWWLHHVRLSDCGDRLSQHCFGAAFGLSSGRSCSGSR